jgi:hypothetical protein
MPRMVVVDEDQNEVPIVGSEAKIDNGNVSAD